MDPNHTISEAQELKNSLKMLISSPEKTSFRKVMELSASIANKHAFVPEIKSFINEEFSMELDFILKETMVFEDVNINIENVKFINKSWINGLHCFENSYKHEEDSGNFRKPSDKYKEYKAEATIQKTTDINENPDEFKCEKAVKALKFITELLELQFANIKLLEKILLPLSKKCTLFDKQVNIIEYIYLKILYKTIKRNKKGIQGLISLVLIIGNGILSRDNSSGPNLTAAADQRVSTGKEAFFRRFSSFLDVLKGFGIKDEILWNSKDLMIEHDFNILKNQKVNFYKVYQYLKDQKNIYSKSFHRKIEKFILKKLYSDFDDSIILSKFMSAEDDMSSNDIKYVLKIFTKTGNKKRLLDIYEKFIGIACKNFNDLVEVFKINKKVLKEFNDEDFEKIYYLSIEKFFESLDNCQKASDFINDIMTNQSCAIEPRVYEIFHIVVFLVEKSKSVDLFLNELEKKLSLRLFSYDKNEVEQCIKKELAFITLLQRAQSEKMTCMISDFSNPAREDGNSVLLMKVCKWPVFKTDDIVFGGNEISEFKRCFKHKMKSSKKKISWIDSLSFVKVELFGQEIILSLFQYSTVVKIIEEGEKFPGTGNMAHASYKIKKSSLNIPKLYLNQFRSLIKTVLVEDEEHYLTSQRPMQPPKFQVEFFDSSNDECGSFSYSLKAFYEAKISKILKKEKALMFDDLHLKLSDLNVINKDQLREYVEGLVQKGIIEFDDRSNNVSYST